MNFWVLGLTAGASAAVLVAAWCGIALKSTKRRLSEAEARAQELQGAAERAAIRSEMLEKEKLETQARAEGDRTAREEAVAARYEAERKLSLAEQRALETEKRMQDWEKTQVETLKATKAAIMEAGGQMSSKLLEDHKREQEAAKKETEELTKKTTEQLFEQFQAVVKNVASLSDQVGLQRNMVDTVMRSLSSPGGAGHYAEIGLENLLKKCGLEPNRDFVMQATITDMAGGGSLRPDALIYLPGDAVMVIDSKASKIMLDLAEAEAEHEEAKTQELCKRMRSHLKSLAGKDYRNAVASLARQSGHSDGLKEIISVMHLPTDAVIERVQKGDGEFMLVAGSQNIIVTGPNGLHAAIALARYRIDLGKQAENYDRVMHGIQDLLHGMAVSLTHADKLGKGLKSAADNFSKFSKSVNRTLLPRARSLMALGLRPSGNKALPEDLPAYEVMTNEPVTIEQEREEERRLLEGVG